MRSEGSIKDTSLPFATAITDFVTSIKDWRIWTMLALQDIKLRYRRSTLGPFWITISMAITIYTMGFLYGHLFKANLTEYFPFLAAGIISWNFISTMLIESTFVFAEAESYFRNIHLSCTTFILRVISRNLIVFAHNCLAFIPIIYFFKVPFDWHLLLLIPGLIIIMINGICYITVIGFIGTRFRDLSQIIVSLVQVVFFLTPIMWMPNLLPAKYQIYINFNPFYQILNLLRNPLLGKGYPLLTLAVVMTITFFGIFLYAFMVNKYRKRLIFWL